METGEWRARRAVFNLLSSILPVPITAYLPRFFALAEPVFFAFAAGFVFGADFARA
jgi:hypothetical protein